MLQVRSEVWLVDTLSLILECLPKLRALQGDVVTKMTLFQGDSHIYSLEQCPPWYVYMCLWLF